MIYIKTTRGYLPTRTRETGDFLEIAMEKGIKRSVPYTPHGMIKGLGESKKVSYAHVPFFLSDNAIITVGIEVLDFCNENNIETIIEHETLHSVIASIESLEATYYFDLSKLARKQVKEVSDATR